MIKRLNNTDYVFLFISFLLYMLFMFFPNNVPVVILEYLGIVLCLAYSLLIKGHIIDTWLVRFALCFTVLADFFLLVLEDFMLIGVLCFTVVQILYAIRLTLITTNTNWNRIEPILIRVTVIVFLQWIRFSLIKSDDVLLMATFFYIANLITNVILGMINYKCNLLFTTGLVLFLCCDIFVGLYNSNHYINLSRDSVWYQLIHLPVDLMWLFYYPSQVLITLSILTNNCLKSDYNTR